MSLINVNLFQNRLEIYLGKMIVSLERAYHMFLAHDDSDQSGKLTKNEYIVYANFMRFGCHIRRFKNECVVPSTSTEEKSHADESDQTDTAIQKSYIWNYLYELLGHQKTSITSNNIDTNRYSAVKESMNAIIGQFKADDSFETIPSTSETTNSESVQFPEKRKFQCDRNSDVQAWKTVKINQQIGSDAQYFGSGSTNDFMIGNSFQKFKQIFDKIDYIDLMKPESYDDQKPLNEKFSFDLWANLDNRNSPKHKGPDFRLIVK